MRNIASYMRRIVKYCVSVLPYFYGSSRANITVIMQNRMVTLKTAGTCMKHCTSVTRLAEYSAQRSISSLHGLL